MKLALVHDWLKDLSGAERVLIALHEIYPHAPIYTLFYDKKFVRQYLPGAHIRASFLQKIPFISKIYPAFGWLMPIAIESFDLSQFDRVLSSSAVFSKGLVLNPSTTHICYCYSPTRFAWDNHANYSQNWFSKVFQHFFRLWDYGASSRADQYVAISKTVQARIQKYYRRDSIIIYPPITVLNEDESDSKAHVRSRVGETEHKTQTGFDVVRRESVHPSHYYLIVSRLYKYKNIDIAIEAFNKLGYPLVIIGDGPDRGRLQRMSHRNITFLGEQPDAVLAQYYDACRAFIMPQEEDFGLTPLEAMSFGKPVVALRRGGATETVIEGVTGEFFDDPIPEAVADAIRRLNENYAAYNPDIIKINAGRFSPEEFKKHITALLS